MSSDKNFESDSDPVLDILKQLPEQWPKNQDTLELQVKKMHRGFLQEFSIMFLMTC